MNRAYRHAEKSDLLGSAWSGRSIKRLNHRVSPVEAMITKGIFGEYARAAREAKRQAGLVTTLRALVMMVCSELREETYDSNGCQEDLHWKVWELQ